MVICMECVVTKPDLSYFDENFQIVLIEIEEGQQRHNHNVIIGVIYRPSNQDISSFNDKMNIIENIVRRKKTCCLLWDYNINILNYANYAQNAQFVDMMSSYVFLPLITRPSRVTATSATLIDNIFTKNIGDIHHSVQGLFITDISDYFLVFHIAKQMEIKENDT